MAMYVISIVIASVTAFLIHAVAKKRHRQHELQNIRDRNGCKSPHYLPSSWILPFGLDKLRGSLRAERQRRFPPFCLSENEKHGETYSQHAGGQYVVITRDPRNVHAVLSTQFKDFHYGSVRKGCFHPLLGEGIFTNDGDKWARSRTLLASAFHGPGFPNLNILEKHVQMLLAHIKQHADANQRAPVDLQKLFYLFTFDSATEFLLGKSADTLSGNVDSDGYVFSEAFNTAVRWLAIRERFKAFYWLVDGIEFRRTCRSAKNALEKIIAGTTDSTESILHKMLLEKRDPKEVRDEIMNVLFAGRDSSTSLLSWTFYSLAREPQVCQRLRNEIVNTIGLSREPQNSEITQMEYLDCVINETLRLFPAVPLNGRLCCRDTTLPAGGGEDGESPILIPKGTLICYHTYATQRAQHLYGDDADKYRPERWFKRTKREMTMNWSLHPFSGGPRKCLGEIYAIKQAKYVVCRLLQHFSEITACDSDGKSLTSSHDTWQDEVKYQIGLTMAPDDGTWVLLKNAKRRDA